MKIYKNLLLAVISLLIYPNHSAAQQEKREPSVRGAQALESAPAEQ